MSRVLIGLALGVVLLVSSLRAQDDIQKGKIKKVDTVKNVITIATDGKDQEFLLTATTHIKGAAEHEGTEGLKDSAVKEGAAVRFKAMEQDGRKVLLGLLAGEGNRPRGGGQPGDIRRGTIKKLDVDRLAITMTIDGKDRDFALTPKTYVLGGEGKDLKERLQGFKTGAAMFFKAQRQDGKDVIVAMKLDDGRGGPRPGPQTMPKVDTSKLKPLTELGTDTYQGHKGGLYPHGKNERPAAHEKAGLALARTVMPLDDAGKPSADGKIVLLSIGMSNTTQVFSAFKRIADNDPDKNPRLVIVDGAQGGQTAFRIKNLEEKTGGLRFWTTIDQRLQTAGVSRAQVQAAWIKEADAGPSQGFPKYAQTLQAELKEVLQLMHDRFPNLRLVYLSSRTYGGYATTRLNPEPYAFESGLSVKWLIEEQLKGDPELNFNPSKGAVKAPWLSWGPYLWANGTTKRADGFFYEQSDFGSDGTHPSQAGVRKVADLLLRFFKTDSTTRSWFVTKK